MWVIILFYAIFTHDLYYHETLSFWSKISKKSKEKTWVLSHHCIHHDYTIWVAHIDYFMQNACRDLG